MKVLFYLFLAMLFIYPQNPTLAQDNSGTLLKYSSEDPDMNSMRLITISDIDKDNIAEQIMLFIDSLIILSGDSIKYYKAFDTTFNSFVYGAHLDCNINPDGETVIYLTGVLNSPFYRNIWTRFYPTLNLFNYGHLSDYFQDGFSIDSQGSLWYVEKDSMTWENEGIYRSDSNFPLSEFVINLGAGDSTYISSGNGTFRTTIFSSQSQGCIEVVRAGTNLFNSGNPGGCYLYSTSDNGVSWTGESIIRGRMGDEVWGQISNRDMGAHISPFNDYWCVIDDNGVTHISLYGIGKSVQGHDTLQCFPILYWNSRDKNWIAISDFASEGFYDKQGNIIGTYAPGWGAGQSLPMISTSKDGNIIIVGWTSPEYLGDRGSQLNIYPGDGSVNSKAVYYTDLIANISLDGGKTWNEENIFSLKNQQNVQEQFLIMNDYLRFDSLTGKIQMDYMYLIDEIPGNSGWGNNSASNNNKLYYDSLIIYTNPVSTIEKITLYDFSLSQNFPNPFNPSTKITYSVAGLSKVSLKVYDILGREIVTLVNEEKQAGKYEVNFNASQLASGVYFYHLKAGDFIQSKKMILIK